MVIWETVSGTLDFYYQITTNPNNPHDASIGGVSWLSFAGFTTDVDFRTDLGGTIPWPEVLRGSGAGAFFNVFLPTNPTTGARLAIAPGQTTDFFFIKTDATQFDTAGFSAFLGAGGGAFTFEPIAAQVSEPPTSLLFGASLAALTLAERYRRGRISRRRLSTGVHGL